MRQAQAVDEVTVIRGSRAAAGRVRRFLLCLFAAFIGTSCAEPRWDRAEAFRKELRCGLTTAEVREVATKYGADVQEIPADARFGDHALRHGSTAFWFSFSEGGLATVKQGHYYGLSGLDVGPRENLCSGQKVGTLTLTITGPAEFAGAQMMLDGRKSARLSLGSRPEINIVIEHGSHHFRFEKPGYEPIERRVNHSASDREAHLELGPAVPEP